MGRFPMCAGQPAEVAQLSMVGESPSECEVRSATTRKPAGTRQESMVLENISYTQLLQGLYDLTISG